MTNPLTIPRILIFDSGVGGLSILQAVRNELPGCEYYYASDNAAFPYGTKTEQELILRLDKVLKKLTLEISPDIIVIACNTASTVALPHIRAHFSMPIVGVVPAIKPAASISKTGVIGLLGTPGTVTREYTNQLIHDFARHCEIIRVGSSELVEIAEAKLRGNPIDLAKISGIISPFFELLTLDTIILACTHFPLMELELKSAAPRDVNWVDSGHAIARRVASLITPVPDKTLKMSGIKAFFTSDHEDLTPLKPGLVSYGCEQVKIITI